MSKILGFYSSAYSEPRKNLKSLGGEPNIRLHKSDAIGAVFNDVEEYEATSTLEDFRIIYLTNISKNYSIIRGFILSVTYDLDTYMDRSAKLYLNGINMFLFTPSYVDKNYVHPVITGDGTFRDTDLSMRNIIRDESTQTTYGKSIVIEQELATGEFMPIVLHRKVRGPVPYLRNYKLTIKASFAVG